MTNYREIETVAIVGTGVMGSKVAWACIAAGLQVRLFDTDEKQLEAALITIENWLQQDAGAEADVSAKMRGLTTFQNLAEALKGVDLAFENVPEQLPLKNRVHRQIHELLDADALLGSNASSLVSSSMAEPSGRPELFFCMNFCDPRSSALVEIMLTAMTPDSTLKRAEAWARKINMVPVVTRKEIRGYTFNRIWRAIKKESLFLADGGYADPEDIDRAFMLGFDVNKGPFAMMDEVGLHSVLRVEEQYYQASEDPSDRPPGILIDMVEAGKLGVCSGSGFYQYPDPAFSRPGWIDRSG